MRHNSLKPGQATGIFAVSTLCLALALWLFDAALRRGLLTVIAAVIVISLVQVIFQPLLRLISRQLGLIGIAVVCLLSSTALVWLALELIPGIRLQDAWDGLFIAWSYALLITIVQWLLVARSDDIFLQEIVRTSRRADSSKMDAGGAPGTIFIQIDGLSAPLLDWQLKAGNLPNIAQLIRDEGYCFDKWIAQLPSTTPASQAGILLGSNRDIPGFRWYEKATGNMIVANEPEGATIMEARHSNGRGLLADGGVSVGNLFSGDAPTNLMVMSKLSGNRESVRHIDGYTAYFSSPFGYMRSVILAAGEIVKELYQARRQVAHDIRPRIKRRVDFIVQRVATNVLLRYLQTYIVVRNMLAGTNRLYVDYLDYDEIAHHAGIARPGALAALVGIDSVIGIIARARQYAGRPYAIVLLSDHGQSQGTTFRQLHGDRSLSDIVQGIAGDDTVVTGSGNLGGVWFTDLPGRATYEDIQQRYPQFVRQLLQTKGIGLVLVASATRGPLCISSHGELQLDDGTINGRNPLEAYDDADAASLSRLASMPSSPDLSVIASYDANSGETHAFEELVGNHGSIGGWQRQAVLLHPPHLTLPKRFADQPIVGAEVLHKILQRWAANPDTNGQG